MTWSYQKQITNREDGQLEAATPCAVCEFCEAAEVEQSQVDARDEYQGQITDSEMELQHSSRPPEGTVLPDCPVPQTLLEATTYCTELCERDLPPHTAWRSACECMFPSQAVASASSVPWMNAPSAVHAAVQ